MTIRYRFEKAENEKQQEERQNDLVEANRLASKWGQIVK